MAANNNLSNTTPVWLMITCAMLLVARSFLDVMISPSSSKAHAVKWQTYKEASTKVIRGNTPAWIFITHGEKCKACAEAEYKQDVAASEINKNYIPIKLIDTRLEGKPLGEVEKRIVGYRDTPCIKVVQPQDVEENGSIDESGSFEFGNVFGFENSGWSDFLRDPYEKQRTSDSRESSIYDSLRDPQKSVAPLVWLPFKEEMLTDTRSKPILMLFLRARDSNDFYHKNSLFEHKEIADLARSKFRTVMVLDRKRVGEKNTESVQHLIDQLHITDYPALVVLCSGKPPQKLPGRFESEAALEFLQQISASQ
jgi:hypothetical protein